MKLRQFIMCIHHFVMHVYPSSFSVGKLRIYFPLCEGHTRVVSTGARLAAMTLYVGDGRV